MIGTWKCQVLGLTVLGIYLCYFEDVTASVSSKESRIDNTVFLVSPVPTSPAWLPPTHVSFRGRWQLLRPPCGLRGLSAWRWKRPASVQGCCCSSASRAAASVARNQGFWLGWRAYLGGGFGTDRARLCFLLRRVMGRQTVTQLFHKWIDCSQSLKVSENGEKSKRNAWKPLVRNPFLSLGVCFRWNSWPWLCYYPFLTWISRNVLVQFGGGYLSQWEGHNTTYMEMLHYKPRELQVHFLFSGRAEWCCGKSLGVKDWVLGRTITLLVAGTWLSNLRARFFICGVRSVLPTPRVVWDGICECAS